MAVSVQQLIDRAFRLAVGVGQDPNQAISIDNVWVFEEAFPLALNNSINEIGISSAEIEHYRRAYALTLTNGSVALPQDIMHNFLDSSTISSDTDPSVAPNSSFCDRYSEFLSPPHPQLHYYATLENTFKFREANQLPNVFNGTINLYAVSVPAIPATLAGTMAIPDDVADRTVEILAQMIRGGGATA